MSLDVGALAFALLLLLKAGVVVQLEIVDDVADNLSMDLSLAVDAQGVPHISYYHGGNGNLKYATRAGGNWTTEIVDTNGDVGKLTSLAVAADGVPHIGYFSSTDGTVKYATKSPQGWRVETVGPSGGRSISIAVGR